MPDFGAVRQEVLEDLRRIRTEEAYGPWLEGLQTSAKIEIRKDALRKVLVPGIDSTAPKPGKTTLPDPNPERRKP